MQGPAPDQGEGRPRKRALPREAFESDKGYREHLESLTRAHPSPNETLRDSAAALILESDAAPPTSGRGKRPLDVTLRPLKLNAGKPLPPDAYAAPTPGECHFLDEISGWIARYAWFGHPWVPDVLALWASHTYMLDHFDTTPRLVLASPLMGSGKTRVLDLLRFVVREPLMTASITGASVFRRVNAGPVTLLMDEMDTQWGTESSEQLRGLLNSGYKRGSTVVRQERTRNGRGSGFSTVEFEVFAPVALAGLGTMPPTILDRAIVVRMRRPPRDVTLPAFQQSAAQAEIKSAVASLQTWAADLAPPSSVEVPSALRHRAVEVWEPLLRLAACAGPSWLRAAQSAAACHVAVTDVTDSGGDEDIALLRELARIAEESPSGHLLSADLVHELEDVTLKGKPLTAHALAHYLRGFGVGPTQARVPGKANAVRGYAAQDLLTAASEFLSD